MNHHWFLGENYQVASFCVTLRSSWLSAVQDPLGLPQKACLIEIGDKLTTLSFAGFLWGLLCKNGTFACFPGYFLTTKVLFAPVFRFLVFSVFSLHIRLFLLVSSFSFCLTVSKEPPIRGEVASLLSFWEPKSYMDCRLLEPC